MGYLPHAVATTAEALMQTVPLSGVPSQTLQIVLAQQNCQIAVYQKGAHIYLDLSVDGTPILNCRQCVDQGRLLLGRQYLGFVGDLMFDDTQGSDDPEYTGLGSRWILVYLEATDLP